MSTQEHTQAVSQDASQDDGGIKMRKIIWKTFWILLFITVFEVAIAFWSLFPHNVLKLIFIALTIVKAYYIVGFFMHLKHERVHFAWTIVLPFVLIVYFIYMLMTEGNALNNVRMIFGL